MAKFFDALFYRSPPPTAQLSNVTTAQPVPVANAIEPPSDLTSGSSLNETAFSAWPRLLDANHKYRGGWVPSVLKEVYNKNIAGNYGLETSKAHFSFRYQAFPELAGSPIPIPNPYVHEYNDLVPIVWGQRVPNPNTQPNTTAQKGPITIQATPSVWQGSNTASLSRTGEVLL